MSNPTSNFGWVMPTNTDLVTDLPADFAVFGQGVDTTMADLKGGTTGQILSKATNTDMDFVWIANDQGDITAVNVTSPITGGGTSGAVTVGIQSASTSQAGAVQLSDSTSTTSSVLAATPTAVKAAYDKASTAATTSVAGIVQLSDSTSTTSSVLASTPTATKSAYDLASSAYAPAFTNNFYAGKNKIINGAFNVWQRGTSITPSAGATTYTADRFFVVLPAGSTVSRQSFTAGTAPVAGYEGQYYMNTVITANAQNYEAGQKIENARTFAGQTVTLSFWARSTVGAQTLNVLLQQNFGTGGSPSASVDGTFVTSSTGTAQYTPTSTWTRYWFTYTMGSVSGKTFGTNDNSYLLARPFQYTATTTNTSLDIWGVQVEAGSTVTPFQTATGSIQGELAACQRYYTRWSAGAANSYIGCGNAYSTTTGAPMVTFPVEMRVYPTALETSGVLLSDDATNYSGGTLTLAAGNTKTASIRYVHGSATLTALRFYYLGITASTGYLGLSAEL